MQNIPRAGAIAAALFATWSSQHRALLAGRQSIRRSSYMNRNGQTSLEVPLTQKLGLRQRRRATPSNKHRRH